MKIKFGPDDWMVLAALLLYLAGAGVGIAMSLQGFGQHTFLLSPDQISRAFIVRIVRILYL